MSKASSDEMATLASRVVDEGNPFDSVEVERRLLRAIDVADTPARKLAGVRAVLDPYFRDMQSLAGSVLSQAE